MIRGQPGDTPDWQRLERMIEGYTLEYGPRDPYVERLGFPPLVRVYRARVRFGWAPPTPWDFAALVERLVGASLSEDDPRPDPVAVRARAIRAYISLVVQHHAYLVLAERFSTVAWDDDLDMRYGIDLVVIGGASIAVGLALMAPTQRARAYAEQKDRRRYDGLPLILRSLVLEPHAYTAGPFWLYAPETLIAAVDDAVRAYWEAKATLLGAAADAAYRNGQRRAKASRQDFMDGVSAVLRSLRGLAP